MNFLKKALEGAGLAKFEEENQEKPQAKTATNTTPVVENTVTTSIPVTTYANPSDEIKQHLKALLEERNLPGPDYLEFNKTQLSMANIIPVQEIRYKASFSALQAQGLTKDVLLSSAAKYKNILSEELNNFDAVFKQQYSESVETLNTQIAQKQQEALDLSNQLMKLQAEVEEMKIQARNSESNLTTRRNEFASGVKLLQQEIDDEVQKINNTL